jgi:hypothetical protein
MYATILYFCTQTTKHSAFYLYTPAIHTGGHTVFKVPKSKYIYKIINKNCDAINFSNDTLPKKTLFCIYLVWHIVKEPLLLSLNSYSCLQLLTSNNHIFPWLCKTVTKKKDKLNDWGIYCMENYVILYAVGFNLREWKEDV